MQTLSFLSVWLFYFPYLGGAIFILIACLTFYWIHKQGALV